MYTISSSVRLYFLYNCWSMLLIGCDQSISDEDVQSWRGTSIKLLDDIFIPDNVILIKIYKSWHDNRATLSTYFKYPEAVRRLIYTINAIEGFNRQLRKVTKSKTIFPSDDSLLKMLYLATQVTTQKISTPTAVCF